MWIGNFLRRHVRFLFACCSSKPSPPTRQFGFFFLSAGKVHPFLYSFVYSSFLGLPTEPSDTHPFFSAPIRPKIPLARPTTSTRDAFFLGRSSLAAVVALVCVSIADARDESDEFAGGKCRPPGEEKILVQGRCLDVYCPVKKRS